MRRKKESTELELEEEFSNQPLEQEVHEELNEESSEDEIEEEPPQIVESLEIEKHLNREFNELATVVNDRLWKAVEFAGGGKDKDNQGMDELEFKVTHLIMSVRSGTASTWREGLDIAADTMDAIDELMEERDEGDALKILLASRFAAAAEFDMGLKTVHKSLFQNDPKEVKEERDERKRAVVIPEEYWEEAEAE